MRSIPYAIVHLLTISVFISSILFLEKQVEAEQTNISASEESSVREGSYKTYYPNGNVKEEMFYMNGKLNGIFKKYDQEGNLIEEMNFKNGKLDGTFKRYYVNGEYIIEEVFNDGNFISDRRAENVKPTSRNAKSNNSKTEGYY